MIFQKWFTYGPWWCPLVAKKVKIGEIRGFWLYTENLPLNSLQTWGIHLLSVFRDGLILGCVGTILAFWQLTHEWKWFVLSVLSSDFMQGRDVHSLIVRYITCFQIIWSDSTLSLSFNHILSSTLICAMNYNMSFSWFQRACDLWKSSEQNDPGSDGSLGLGIPSLL